MRPRAWVTSIASRAGECCRTAWDSAAKGILKPLKKLTRDEVIKRVLGLSRGIRSSMRKAPCRARHTLAMAGQLGCSQAVAPAGKSRSLMITSSPSRKSSAMAARLYASEVHEHMPISVGVKL